MANPQKENGYTAIANEIMDALCRVRISGEATQVLCVIIRKTYGFNKRKDIISLSQFCLATQMSKSSVARAIRYLRSRKIIETKAYGYASEYAINKNYEEWENVYSYNKLDIFKRDNYMCHICHSVKTVTVLEIDHIIPLWLNGSNKEENLATACITCNRSKGSERLRHKHVTVLSPSQNDNVEGDSFALNGVTKMTHTKDNIQKTKQKIATTEVVAVVIPKKKEIPIPVLFTKEMLEERLLKMEQVEGSYLDIIATYIREKPVAVENSKQLSLVIARFARIAKAAEGAYTNEQINKAIDEIKNDNAWRKRKGEAEIDWTVETIIKKLVKK